MEQKDYIRPEWEKRIDRLLDEMTISEKIGQLTMVGPSPVGGFEISVEEQKKMLDDGRITREEFERAVKKIPLDKQEDNIRSGCLGAFIGIIGAEKTNRLQRIAVEESRLKIPLLFGLDVIHGHHTVFPIPLAESCSWNDALWEETAAAAAYEATADGIKWTFAPMVDIARDARWGRIAEGAGEDPYLGARCAAAKVKGFQGEDCANKAHLLACAKHFVAYGAAVGGRDYNTVDMSEQLLYENYLPPFLAAVRAGAATLMPAFNDLNGVPCTVSRKLLTRILREEMGFQGFVISDANAIAECVNHGYSADRRDAAKQALYAGTDMDMGSFCYPEHLQRLLEDGELTTEQIDNAVRRVLRIKFAAGLFERPYCENNNDVMPRDKYRALAREAAAKSAVLLKNSGILPLKKENDVILVGALADQPQEMLGTWSIVGKAEDTISVKDGLAKNGISFSYYPCCGPTESINESELENAISENAATVIAIVGESVQQSGEAASRSEIGLPGEQLLMLQRLHSAGKRVITVLCNGRPLALREVLENSDAVLELWHAGSEAGNAAFDILYGNVNPSGRLIVTFPNHSGECPVYYNHPNTGRPCSEVKFSSKYIDSPIHPLFPFGYGLSYTNYEYRELNVSVDNNHILAEITVENIGERDGIETVQVYIRDITASRVRPVAELKEFRQIFLKAGESARVKFSIPIESLGFYDEEMRHIVEKGTFGIQIGHDSVSGLSSDFNLFDSRRLERF